MAQPIKEDKNITKKSYKTKKQPRFDIVEVIVEGREVISINHIEKAF